MNTLTNMNNFPIGNSLDGVNIISEEISTLSLLVDGTNSMQSDLNINFHNIKNMEAGVNGNDAVNKSQLDTKSDITYVDTQLALKANTTYVDTQLALKANLVYVDASLNDLKSYTNTSINDLQIYTDSSLNLLRNDLNNEINNLTTYTDASLNLLRNDLTNEINDLETYTDSSLSTLTNYVNNQDNLKVNKAGDTMTDLLQIVKNNSNQLLLKSNTGTGELLEYTGIKFNHSIKDVGLIEIRTTDTLRANSYMSFNINDNDVLRTRFYVGYDQLICYKMFNMDLNKIINLDDGTANNHAVNKGQLDLKLNKAGDTMTGTLNMNNNRITNLLDPLNAQNASTKNYVDNQSTNTNYLLRNGTLAMTGALTMNNVLNLNGATVVGDETADFKTNTYIRFGEAGATSDWAYLRQIGGSNDMHLGIDFHDDLSDGKFSLRSVHSTANPDTFHTFFNASPAGVIIDKNAMTPTVSNSSSITLGGGIIDYNLTSTTNPIIISLETIGGSSSNLVGKTINISFPNTTSIKLDAINSGSINVNGTSYIINVPPLYLTGPSYSYATKRLKLICTSKGYYSISEVNQISSSSSDQLTLRTQLGETVGTEFTGIKFLNTNTDAGFIRVETNTAHTDATMSFQVRQSNNIIKPLELNSFINANVPIIRNAWSSGELIKTEIYNQSRSGYTTINNTVTGDWVELVTLSFSPQVGSNVSTCYMVVHFDISYYLSGSANDNLWSKVEDTTGGTQLGQVKYQYWSNATGGGTRSGVIFPITCSYTPTNSTTATTRTIKISAKYSGGGSDVLTMGHTYPEVNSPQTWNSGWWTAEIKQIKS